MGAHTILRLTVIHGCLEMHSHSTAAAAVHAFRVVRLELRGFSGYLGNWEDPVADHFAVVAKALPVGLKS